MNNFIFTLFTFLLSIPIYSQTLTPTGNLNQARTRAESQSLNNGNILVFGGQTSSLSSINSSEIYSLTSGTWSFTSPMNISRTQFSSVKLKSGKIMAIGGKSANQATANCEIYDPATNNWTNVANLNIARFYHTAILLNNGKVLVAGGGFGGNSTEIYNPYDNTWTIVGDMNFDRQEFTLTKLDNGNILAVGGEGSGNSTAEIYHVNTYTWQLNATNTLSGKNAHSAVKLANNDILFIGGLNNPFLSEVYNQSTKTFTASTNSLDEVRVSCKAVLLSNNNVLIYGHGNIGSGLNSKVIEVYNISTNSWFSNTYNTLGTQHYGLDKLQNGAILISGGDFGSNASSDCKLITVAETSNCAINTNLIFYILNDTICYGNNSLITIENTQAGYTYKAVISNEVVSSAVAGGGTITLTIPHNMLAIGRNEISVSVSKTGCNTKLLDFVDYQNVIVSNTNIPTITYHGETTNCFNSEVFITSSLNNILWSNNTTEDTLFVTEESIFMAQSIDTNNCLSLGSNIIEVSYFDSNLIVNAGNNQNICFDAIDFNLSGIPAGGNWFGLGIDSNGLYHPNAIPTGANTLYYEKCGIVDSVIITKDDTIISPVAFYIVNDTFICNTPTTNSIRANHLPTNSDVEFYLNDSLIHSYHSTYSNNSYTIKSLQLDSASIIVMKFEMNCLSYFDTILVENIYMPNYTHQLNPVDTFCQYEDNQITILNSDSNSYYFFYGADTLRGNGGVLNVSTPSNNVHLNISDSTFRCDKVIEYYINFPKADVLCSINNNSSTSNINYTFSEYVAAVGETISLFKNYNHIADYTTWQMNGVYIGQGDSMDFVFNNAGLNSITAYANSFSGCKDSMVLNFLVYDINNNISSFNGNVCQIAELDLPTDYLYHTGFHVDDYNNKYVASYKIQNQGRYYYTLTKFNTNYTKQWTLDSYFHTSNTCNGTYLLDIETDSQGDIYIAGEGSGNVNTLQSHFTGSENISFITKLNSHGNLYWSKYFTGQTMSDIYIENDSTILFTSFLFSETAYSLKVGYGKFGLFQLNENGELQKKVILPPSYSSSWSICCGDRIDYSAYCTQRIMAYGPKILVDHCGNYNVQAVSGQSFNFGQTQNIGTVTSFNAIANINEEKWEDPIVYNKQPTYLPKNQKPVDYDEFGYTYLASSVTPITLPSGLKTYSSFSKLDIDGNIVWELNGTDLEVIDIAVLDSQILVLGNFNNFFGIENTSGQYSGVKTKRNATLLFSLSLTGNINWMEYVSKENNSILNYNKGAYQLMVDKCKKKIYILLNAQDHAEGFSQTFVANDSISGVYIVELAIDSCNNTAQCTNLENQVSRINGFDDVHYCIDDTINFNPGFLASSFVDYTIIDNANNEIALNNINANYTLNGTSLKIWSLSSNLIKLRLNYLNNCGESVNKTISLFNHANITTSNTIEFCDSIQINNNWYYQSQTITNQYFSSFGCDSSFTSHLVLMDVFKGNLQNHLSVALPNTTLYSLGLNLSDSTIVKLDSTVSNSVGDFEFNGLSPDARIKVFPKKSDYPNEFPTYFSNEILFQDALVNKCKLNARVKTKYNFSSTESGEISGYIGDGAITNSIGNPIKNLDLIILKTNGAIYQYTKTDSSGYFQFKNLPCDIYYIYVDDATTNNNLANEISLTTSCEKSNLTYVLDNNILQEIQIIDAISREPNNLQTEILVTPNPVKEKLFFKTDFNKGNINLIVSLKDALGKELVQKRIITNKDYLDFSYYSKGMYILEYQLNGEIFSKRIIKE